MAEEPSSRELSNSALGSWAGYTYQGLCGLYHSLKLIGEDRDKYQQYKLYLDSYEDFAIMNGSEKLVSLHQCKDEKGKTDYADEYKKMIAKKKLFKKKGLCTSDCKLYFHANKAVDVGLGITQYPFTDTQSYCEPGMLVGLIHNQVADILGKDDATVKKVVFSLVALIDQKVLDIHQKYIPKSNRKALREIAKESASCVEFQTILERLFAEEEVFAYDRDSYVTRIKYKLIEDLLTICEDEDNEDLTEEQSGHIRFLVEGLRRLDVDGMESFLKRVHPIDNVTNRSIDDFVNIASEIKVQTLFNVVSELEQLETDLSWTTEKGKETPTSLNSNFSTPKLCRKILKNVINQDSLYEYDWLVGDVRENVDNIASYLPTIDDVKGNGRDGSSIFETKKVGLVTKQNKKNGNY